MIVEDISLNIISSRLPKETTQDMSPFLITKDCLCQSLAHLERPFSWSLKGLVMDMDSIFIAMFISSVRIKLARIQLRLSGRWSLINITLKDQWGLGLDTTDCLEVHITCNGLPDSQNDATDCDSLVVLVLVNVEDLTQFIMKSCRAYFFCSI